MRRLISLRTAWTLTILILAGMGLWVAGTLFVSGL